LGRRDDRAAEVTQLPLVVSQRKIRGLPAAAHHLIARDAGIRLVGRKRRPHAVEIAVKAATAHQHGRHHGHGDACAVAQQAPPA